MLLEKNFASRLIYILLFLFSLNLFNQSSLLLAVVFILVVVYDRGRLYIPENDSVFFFLLLFAVSYMVFASQNGFGAGISAIGCPMAYYIGLRVQSGKAEKAYAESQLKSIVFLLVAGMTSHAVVNCIYELIRFGGINSGGIHYDFFSFGAQTSTTGAATYLTLFAGVIFYLIVESGSVKKWAAGILVIIVTFAYNIMLGGRTFFALTGISFAFSLIAYIFGQSTAAEKVRAVGKVGFIVFVLSIVAAVVYNQNRDAITKMFESTYLFHRISYARLSQSQDLLSFFVSSDRINIRNQYIALMFDYPWGGRKILSKSGFFAHELWLDIFDSAGIIPFVLIWVVTFQITLCNLKYVLHKETPIKNRVLLMGITAAVTVQFFFEPVLSGCRALLFSYFLICGLAKSQLSQR